MFVDFAHTPDALIKSINSIKRSYHGNISLVLCRGNRDIKKRPIMAKIASDHCKKFMLLMITLEMKNQKKLEKKLLEILKILIILILEQDQKLSNFR